MQVSEGWRDFTVAVVVRHPLDRLIGLYEHHQHAASKRTDWPSLPWWLFVAMVLANHPDLSWFYRMTIGELLGSQKVDRVIHYESLEADLSELIGEPFELLPGNDNARDLSQYYAQAGPCCQAEWWGRGDMERFGYKSVF